MYFYLLLLVYFHYSVCSEDPLHAPHKRLSELDAVKVREQKSKQSRSVARWPRQLRVRSRSARPQNRKLYITNKTYHYG